MNLWLRLLWLLITAPFKPRVLAPEGVSVLFFRVMPHDLDPSLHMNNGRYLAIMDLGRLDLLVRSGLGKAVWRNGWTPVANTALVRYRRELRLFDRYRLETRVRLWSEQDVIIEQVFVFAGGARNGQVAARALFKGALYDRKIHRYVPIAHLLDLIGAAAPRIPPAADVEAFLAVDCALRAVDRSPQPDADL